MRKMREKGRSLIRSIAIGAIVSVLAFGISAGRGNAIVHSLCDGFFVAAVLLLGVGILRAIRNTGAFDVAGYGIHSALSAFGKNSPEDFMEYRRRKAGKRKGAGSLLVAGTAYLVLSFAMLGLYYAI